MAVAWDRVTREDVVRAIEEYDRLGPGAFFSAHGFAPTTTYDLIWGERRYPPKAVLGTAYELATGLRLASGDFEGGKAGAVKVLGQLGFTIAPRRSADHRGRLRALAASQERHRLSDAGCFCNSSLLQLTSCTTGLL